jgi:hypothetical protein
MLFIRQEISPVPLKIGASLAMGGALFLFGHRILEKD